MKTGYRPSTTEAFRDQCYDCTSYYADGRRDCLTCDCPVYVKHQYRTKEPIFDWVFSRNLNNLHDQRRRLEQLNKDEYINKYVYENGIYKLGSPAIIKARCAGCCHNYSGGRIDCELDTCSLYYWMPYRDPTNIPNYKWLFHFETHRRKAMLNNCTKRIRLNGTITTANDIDKYIKYLESVKQSCDIIESNTKRVRVAVKRIRRTISEGESIT